MNKRKKDSTSNVARDIILMYKEGSSAVLTVIQFYLSILNIDHKIFVTIMAERFQKERLFKSIPDLIHTNQTSIIPKKFIKGNIWFIIDAIKFVNKRKQAAFLFLDAEEAFDNLTWYFKIWLWP